MNLIRIDKFLCDSIGCTRKEAKIIIKKHMITKNNVLVKSYDEKIDIDNDIIKYKDEIIKSENFIYLMMNKPKNTVSAVKDNIYKTVIDILPEEYNKLDLFPVGRLDVDTEGLLLLTNDGEFCHRVISPKKDILKTYYVETDKSIDDEIIKKFYEGITFRDGTVCKSAKLIEYKSGSLVSISEGKFHQVKKMFKSVGLTVTYLKRISIGNLKLDDNLKLGEVKKITPEEYDSIFQKTN